MDASSSTSITRRELLRATVGLVGTVGCLAISGASGIRLARAAEDVDVAEEDVQEYSLYLQTLDFQSLTRVALAEDGYWGMATTTTWQAYLYGLSVTGCIYHQWQANINANPGLTSGWYCDSSLAGDATIRAIQAHCGSGETDGIMGSTTIRHLQARVGTPQDGIISAPSTCVRAIQANFARANRPW